MPTDREQHAIMQSYGDLECCEVTGIWTIWVTFNGESTRIRYQSIAAMYYNVERLMRGRVEDIEGNDYAK